jgi:hypothetical protein
MLRLSGRPGARMYPDLVKPTGDGGFYWTQLRFQDTRGTPQPRLGDLWFVDGGAEKTPPWEHVLALPGVHLHLYGKASARPGRKMGHLTVTGLDAASVQTTALQAAEILGLPTWSAA